MMNKVKTLFLIAIMSLIWGSSVAQNTDYNWTWIEGTNTGRTSVFGTQGIHDSNNIPGGGKTDMYTTDLNGDFWLYGGGIGSSVLWKNDGTGWAWIAGTSTDITGSGFYPDPEYGSQGVADPANRPSVRSGGTIASDSQGNIWLFGGYGEDGHGNLNMRLNDLWKFDGTNWTWISGSDQGNQTAIYGTKGVADAANLPGSRSDHVMWIDSQDNIWVFGGDGWASTTPNGGSANRLNDLWKFDGTNWTWVAGNNGYFQQGIFGTKGIGDPNNTPGARYDAMGWINNNDELYLFGGIAHGQISATGTTSSLSPINDLWKFDGTNWIWIGGADTLRSLGVYGSKGTVAPDNIPSARAGASITKFSNGDIVVHAGYGIDPTTGLYYKDLSDSWIFDGSEWKWQSGPNTSNESPVFGSKGMASQTNTPGARNSAALWSKDDNLYFFGGKGNYGSSYDSFGVNDYWIGETPLNTSDWSAIISTNADGKNSTAEFGTTPTSTDGFDASLDIPLPPAPNGDYLQLFFEHPEFGGSLGDKYRSDYKAYSDYETSNSNWQLSLYSTFATSDTLFINRPNGFTAPIKVIDEDGVEHIGLAGDLEVLYSIEAGETKLFDIVVGDITPPTIELGAIMNGPRIWDKTFARSLTWNVEDPSGITNITTEVSYDGGQSWQLIYTGLDDNFEFTPDANIVLNQATIFRVSATDGASQQFTNTASVSSEHEITIAAPSQSLDYATGWQMVGSPFADTIEPSSVLTEAIRYRWSSSSFEYLLTDSYPNKEGVWLGGYSNGSDQLDGEVGESDATVTVYSGWNMVPVPLFRNVQVDSITVFDGTTTRTFSDAVSDFDITLAQGYNGSGYEFAESLQVFSSYWIGVTTDSLVLTMPIHRFNPALKQSQITEEDELLLTIVDGEFEQELHIRIGGEPSQPAPPPAPNAYKIGLEGDGTILGNTYTQYSISSNEQEGTEIPFVIDGPERLITMNWHKTGFESVPISINALENHALESESGSIEITTTELNSAVLAFGEMAVNTEENLGVPVAFRLKQNYPNPFNPSTTIGFDLPEKARVRIEVFNVTGQKVATIVNNTLHSGSHALQFDASELSSGTYIYRIQAGSFTETRKMILIK